MGLRFGQEGHGHSPQYIKEVEIDEDGTWDEFSFGTNPETSERVRASLSQNSMFGSEP